MFGRPIQHRVVVPFHASTRIRLKNKGQIKDSKKNVIGMTILAQVIKNRLDYPFEKAEFPLYFESGVDDEGSWLKVLRPQKAVKVNWFVTYGRSKVMKLNFNLKIGRRGRRSRVQRTLLQTYL